MIRAVTDADLAAVRAFLEAHVDTSLFLLGNLAALGPRLGSDPRSGNYKLIEEDGRIVAVFSLTRRGNLLVQAAGRTDLAPDILAACQGEPIEVCGAVGEWPTAQALWQRLIQEPGFMPGHDEKEILYGLSPLPDGQTDHGPDLLHGIKARALRPADFSAWASLNSEFLEELHLPLEVSQEERRLGFEARALAHLWWGAFDGRALVSIAGLNAIYGTLGQVGGVYTPPEYRRQGFARATLGAVIRESAEVHRLLKLILFTGESNTASRSLYQSFGFQEIGAYGLMMGTRRPRG